jgi:hypothetical protein
MPYIRIAAFFDKVLASTLGARFEEIALSLLLSFL